jgi:DNA-binding CsgD family transcriptional regulator
MTVTRQPGAPVTSTQRQTASSEPGVLTFALASLSEIEFRLGDWRAAYFSAIEALRLAQSHGRSEDTSKALAQLALVEAGLGREAACRGHGEQALAFAARQAHGAGAALARSALGLLELGLGRPAETVAHLEPLTHGPMPARDTWVPDLAEALIRSGDRDRATDALVRLAAHAESFPARCALDRCRGLLAADDQFERHFARALDGCSHLHEPFERARTELCLGQRLRRAGQRAAARQHLRAALATFDRLGAAPWAETARYELGASVARARRRLDETRDRLTTQEGQVARIVAEGATNREAASRLFVSTKTIETHLGRIYRKLGVRSRTELALRLAEDGLAPPLDTTAPPNRGVPDPSVAERRAG